MRRKETRKLKKQALNYDHGLDSIAELFEYIVTKANVYKSASNKTVALLEKFRTALLVDENNFKQDYDWLNSTVLYQTKDDIMKLINETADIQVRLNISTDRVEELRESILVVMDKLHRWNLGSAIISGKRKKIYLLKFNLII